MPVESGHTETLEHLMSQLPRGAYADNFQPAYADDKTLANAMQELLVMDGVTTPEYIESLQSHFTDIATNRSDKPVVILGRCAEPVDIQQPIQELVDSSVMSHDIALTALPKALVIQRNRGQNTKPRSSEYETLSNGGKVLSYMGDAVNGRHADDRAADPSRMVAAAIQARDLETGLFGHFKEHIPAAHEALLLPYEHPFVRQHNGRKYLLSADLPWIGLRTNRTDGPHVALLRGLTNPVGVKIGDNSTEEHIASLSSALNPEGVPGRMVLMMRVGYDTAALRGILRAIARQAPESIVLYDIHGSTTTNSHGDKVRAVSNIKQQITELSDTCHEAGLRLHGLHIETITDEHRMECVDEPHQLPVHPGGVDPQLNPQQTKEVLEHFGKIYR